MVTAMQYNETTSAFIEVIKKKGTIVDVARRLNISVAEVSKEVARMASKSEKLHKFFADRKWPQNVSSGYIFIGDTHLTVGEHKKRLVKGQHVLAKPVNYKGDKTKRNKNYEIFLPVRVIERKYLLKDRNRRLTSDYNEKRLPEDLERINKELAIVKNLKSLRRFLAKRFLHTDNEIEQNKIQTEYDRVENELESHYIVEIRTLREIWLNDEDEDIQLEQRQKIKAGLNKKKIAQLRLKRTNKIKYIYSYGEWLGKVNASAIIPVMYNGKS